jgi:hypothetical protein
MSHAHDLQDVSKRVRRLIVYVPARSGSGRSDEPVPTRSTAIIRLCPAQFGIRRCHIVTWRGWRKSVVAVISHGSSISKSHELVIDRGSWTSLEYIYIKAPLKSEPPAQLRLPLGSWPAALHASQPTYWLFHLNGVADVTV